MKHLIFYAVRAFKRPGPKSKSTWQTLTKEPVSRAEAVEMVKTEWSQGHIARAIPTGKVSKAA